jgi:hypothetical protein
VKGLLDQPHRMVRRGPLAPPQAVSPTPPAPTAPAASAHGPSGAA